MQLFRTLTFIILFGASLSLFGQKERGYEVIVDSFDVINGLNNTNWVLKKLLVAMGLLQKSAKPAN